MKDYKNFINKNIITESIDLRYNNITKEEAFDFISKTKIYQKLYRGCGQQDEFMIMTPSKFKRKSIENENIHTLILDQGLQWKGYPTRSKSLIGTFSIENANNYSRRGISYIVIPKLNSKIGITPEDNIWESFDGFGKNDPIKFFYGLIKELGLLNILNDDYDLNKLKTNFIKSDKELNITNKDIFEFSFKNINIDEIDFENKEQIWNIFMEYFSPISKYRKTGDFKLFNYDSNFKNNTKEMETNAFWTESDCLMIRNDIYNKYLEEINLITSSKK